MTNQILEVYENLRQQLNQSQRHAIEIGDELLECRRQLQAKEQENRRLREVIEKAPLPSSSGAVFEKFGDPKQWMGEYIEWWLLRQKALVDKINA